MLEIDFSCEGVHRRFEIKHGVGWSFCVLSNCFEEYGQDAYFRDGVFVVENDWITFRALDDRNTVYEVKLSAVKEGKIRFWVPNKKSLVFCGPLGDFEKENGEIDIAAFLKSKNQPEKITICKNDVEPERKNPYMETLEMEIDRSNDVLRFYLTVTDRAQYVESSPENISGKETGSRIKTMTLDKEITFDFCNHSFMEIMRKIFNYCDRKNVKISVSCRDYMIPGHCIDIPHTVITSESFEILFLMENVRVVYVAESIMDNSYYTDTAGGEYNIGNIVRETRKKTKGHSFITDYGASNIWKMVYPEEDEYLFGCGFSL